MAKQFIPSPQQAALFDWIKTGTGNAFVQAVAGAGKTTSLIEGAKFMTGSINMVAFNKKIANELQARLQASGIRDARAGTFHSVGFSAWKFHTKNKFMKVDGYKISNILSEMEAPKEYHAFVKTLVSLAKQAAFGFYDDAADPEAWRNIIEHHDLDMDLDKSTDVNVGIDLAMEVLNKSNEMGRDVVDFDDMIYLPVLNRIKMFQVKWVLVDEAQDTNPARRALASMLVSPYGGRMIWVGDRHQAIYGFTGADADAVDIICKEFKCRSLPLTVTYRCPKSVVSASQAYVSHIQAHETAPEGKVEYIDRTDLEKKHPLLKPDDAILCRKTAPLIGLAYTLIRKGIACHVEGRDIGEGIMKLLTKWKSAKKVDTFLERLENWEDTQVKKARAKKKDMLVESIKDRCDTIRALCEGCNLVQEVINKVQSLFSDTEEGTKPKNLTLSTVHKSKGREWGDVYILGFREYMPSKMAKQEWQKEQETNIIYVAFTRAQNSLTLVG